MNPVKITILALVALAYIGAVIFTIKTKETTEKDKDGNEVVIPLSNGYKARSIVWFTAIAGLLTMWTVQWD